ncbi:MAG: hypothetical protein ACPGN3_12450 [Opitutales bacterium]
MNLFYKQNFPNSLNLRRIRVILVALSLLLNARLLIANPLEDSFAQDIADEVVSAGLLQHAEQVVYIEAQGVIKDGRVYDLIMQKIAERSGGIKKDSRAYRALGYATGPSPARNALEKQSNMNEKVRKAQSAAESATFTLDSGEKMKVSDVAEVTIKETELSNKAHMSAFVHGGVRILNPYSITIPEPAEGGNMLAEDSRPFVESTDSESGVYFEAVYSNRWAWRWDRIFNTEKLRPVADDGLEIPILCAMPGSGYDSFWRNGSWFDFETRIGYQSNGSTTTNAERVSDGNLYTRIDFAPHLFRQDTGFGAYSVNLLGSITAITDTDFFHSDIERFGGLGFTAHVKQPFQSVGNGPMLVNIRIGWARLDEIDVDENYFLINAKENPGQLIPNYKKETKSMLGAEFMYPISDTSFLTFGGEVYNGGDDGLDTWRVYLGLTTDLMKIAEAF